MPRPKGRGAKGPGFVARTATLDLLFFRYLTTDECVCCGVEESHRDTEIKRVRAHGGCLGTGRRRRTWSAAISLGELQTSCDPRISEWGNPVGRKADHLPQGRSKPGELKHLSTRRKRKQPRSP